MPPMRNIHPIAGRDAPSMQTPTPTVVTAHFLRQIEANHVRTPSLGRPIPLHFNVTTQSLSEWSWPCDPIKEERIPPSELEPFRRTHRFRTPCCLCPLLDGTKYAQSMIAIVETVTADQERNQSILNGEYVAVCAKKRCGFFLCLERFYSLSHVKLQVCYPRKKILLPQELATISDIDKSLRAGDGLFQLMTDVVVRGSGKHLEKMNPEAARKKNDALMNELRGGMSEQKFWATFVQCLTCKKVTLRKNFAVGHVCRDKSGAVHPYPRLDRVLGASGFNALGSTFGFPSSPTPTDVAEYDVFGEVDLMQVGNFDADILGTPDNTNDVVASSDGIPSLLSDDSFELPTVAEIMASVPRRVGLHEV